MLCLLFLLFFFFFFFSFFSSSSSSLSFFLFSSSSSSFFFFSSSSLSFLSSSFLFWRDSLQWARASSFLRFLDHTQRRTTVGRTPLDELSARHRDLYLTTHNTHKRQTSMPPMGYEPTIPASERSQIYALVRAATGTVKYYSANFGLHYITIVLRPLTVVSCAVPVGNVVWMLFQEGRISNIRLRRGVGQAAHTRNNPHVKCTEEFVHKQRIMLLLVKCVEFYSRDCRSLHYHAHWSSSSIRSCSSPFEIILQTATRAQSSYSCTHDPTHCSCDKHLARPHINKKKQKETTIPPMPGLLTKK